MSICFSEPGNRKTEIVHKGIKPEREEITIDLDKDHADRLNEIRETFSRHGLTVNNLLIAVIEDAAKNPEFYKKEM